MSLREKLSSLARRFLQPRNATQRQYEALRAYCVERLPAAQVAARFGYTTASFRALVHQFRLDSARPFFLTPAKGPHAPPKKDQHRNQVIALRKQNLSIYDISRALHQAGQTLSPAAVAQILREEGFDLDFHTIPFHGDDALVEKHYIAKRSRQQKGVLAFLAHDADTRVFCYAQADLRKDEQADAILQFVTFWKQRTGRVPEELIFDSKLTTYANLNRLNSQGVQFITLRRRSPTLLRRMANTPASAWRRIELTGVSRLYKTPRLLDQRVTLRDYDGPLRQLLVTDLGHEEPTILLTNQLHRSAATLIQRYAQRMLVENAIEDGIDFFHLDALSSAVALKINCDLLLTLLASSLYRLLGLRLGHGYDTGKARHLFRDFVDATATIRLTKAEVIVRFQKRAHNPLLLAAGFHDTDVPVPWLGRKHLRLELG
jgi:transposase